MGSRTQTLACALALFLGACGSADHGGMNGGAGDSGHGGSTSGHGGATSGNGGSTSGTGGSAGRAGSTGSSAARGDGFNCEGPPAHEKCEPGQLCCAGMPPSGGAMCVAAGTGCGACKDDYCGTVACDGPEDCGGKPCCSHNTVTDMAKCPAGGSCPRVTFVVECAETCEAPAFQLCHGFECPDGMTCKLNPTGPPFLPRCQ